MPDMNALIRKEIRLIIWPCIAAVFLAVVPAWFFAMRAEQIWSSNITSTNNFIIQLALYAFALGCLILCLATFGQEFSNRTFTLTLAQPIDRKQLWRTKTIVLAIAVSFVTLMLLLSIRGLIVVYWTMPPAYDPYQHLTPGYKGLIDRAHAFPLSAMGAILAAITIYSGALWTTLLLRNFFTAFALTILVPLSILLCVAYWVGENDAAAHVVTPIILVLYSVAGFAFARWLFLRAQDVIWTGGNISVPRVAGERWGLLTSFGRTNPYIALLKKELQLQQVAFIVGAILFVCHLATLPFRRFIDQHPSNPLVYVIIYVFVIWFALPVLIGSAAVADERRIGTHEMSLTQPISRAVQLFIKLVVTLLLSIVLAALVPYVLEQLAFALGAPQPMITHDSLNSLIGISAGLGGIAFFNSAKARSSLDAFCLSIVSIGPIAAVVEFFTAENSSVGKVPSYGLLTPYICAGIFVPIIVWCVWRNYRRIQVRWTAVISTWSVIAMSMLAAWGVCSFVWNRGWEVFVRLEPRHGAPIMHIDDRAKVLSVPHGAMAILPDGRVWTTEYNYEVVYDEKRREHVIGAALKKPHFLPGTWLDIAAHPNAFAIKADHTLWNLRPAHRETNANGRVTWKLDAPQQIGMDSDWASITSGGAFMLGIKQDGALWGWGSATSGALGATTNKEFLTPVSVWPGTHWSKVFASGAYCLGVQSDGTAWQWGDDSNAFSAAQSKLRRSEFSGDDLTSFSTAFHPVEFATRGDHTLWSTVSERWLGHLSGDWTTFGYKVNASAGLHRIGNDDDWKEITSSFPLCALKTDGTWLAANGYSIDRGGRAPVKLSGYSDWIAIDSGNATPIGLAADGTIVAWMRIDSYPYYTSLTRRPTWTTNIFQTASR
jgi:ABC-type transport system involved in multi-copper enzyme maturation permease subunit